MNKPQKSSSAKALALTVEFGFIIVLPLVVFVSIGKWLSSKYDSKLFLIAALLLSVSASSIWLYLHIKDIYEDFKNK